MAKKAPAKKPAKKRRSLDFYNYDKLVEMAGGAPVVTRLLQERGYQIEYSSVRAWKGRNSIPAPYVFDVLKLAKETQRIPYDKVLEKIENP